MKYYIFKDVTIRPAFHVRPFVKGQPRPEPFLGSEAWYLRATLYDISRTGIIRPVMCRFSSLPATKEVMAWLRSEARGYHRSFRILGVENFPSANSFYPFSRRYAARDAMLYAMYKK